MDETRGDPEPEVLYHYCSIEAFFSIISNRTIRLSSLLLANDSQEGQLVRRRLIEIANGHRLEPAQQQELASKLEAFERENHGFGFCLSAAKDRLSQWRGYANDGQGVAIGFDTSSLRNFAEQASKQPDRPEMFLNKLVYDPEAQRRSLEPAFRTMAEPIARGGLDNDSPKFTGSVFGEKDSPTAYWRVARDAREALSRTVANLYAHLYSMKSDAFIEEEEVRLLSLTSADGHHDVRYRPTANKLIPYLEISIPGDLSGFIREVWLGPKNQTPENFFHHFLDREGYPGTLIERSAASYR